MPGKSSLGRLFYDDLANSANKELRSITKEVLLLPHGQASVERGFSVNREALAENMAERTVTALRLVKAHQPM